MTMPAKQTATQDAALENFLQHCHRKNYPAKATLIHEGDQSDTLYYIIDGSVSVLIEDKDDREIVLAYLNPGDFFGEMGLFEDDLERSAWVVARTPCEMAEINYAQFKKLAMENPKILWWLTTQLAARLRKTNQKVSDLAFLDVTGRVAHTLLELAHSPDAITHPDGMQIRITRQEIAKIVGCSREMVGRVLKDLEAEGFITAKGKTMVVFGTR